MKNAENASLRESGRKIMNNFCPVKGIETIKMATDTVNTAEDRT